MDSQVVQAVDRKIMIFSARYLPSMGGVEFFTRNLSEELARRGNEVIIVCLERAEEGMDVADDVTLASGGSVHVVRLDSWGWWRMPFIKWSGHTRRCLKEIRRNPPDSALINTRLYGLSRLAARMMNECGLCPVLLDHGSSSIRFESALLTKVSAGVESFVTALIKRRKIAFFGISKESSAWLGHFGITSRGEINNAVDADTFVSGASERDFRDELGIGPDTLCVVFTGRLIRDKGIDAIVDAARALEGRDDVRFVVAGAGPLEPEITKAAEDLATLTFVGRLDHGDIASLLISSDVFCLPSYSEGLPTSVLEAAACSCALMYTRCGGVNEIIPSPEYGIVLESSDGDEVARHVVDLADDPARLAALKDAAARRVRQRFSWAHTADQALEAFEVARRMNEA